jgi:hypothetical protein
VVDTTVAGRLLIRVTRRSNPASSASEPSICANVWYVLRQIPGQISHQGNGNLHCAVVVLVLVREGGFPRQVQRAHCGTAVAPTQFGGPVMAWIEQHRRADGGWTARVSRTTSAANSGAIAAELRKLGTRMPFNRGRGGVVD